MNRLEKAKKIVKDNFGNAMCGIFHTRNTIGDPMETLYVDSEVIIDICRPYMYFEVFGLSKEEFSELKRFYEDLRIPDSVEQDENIEAKLREIEESIEIRSIDKPYTLEEKYNLCTKVKRILDAIME